MRVLVTGGTNGMGLGVARALASRGVEVVVLGRNPRLGAETVAALGAGATFVSCDLSRLSEVRAAIEVIRRDYDRLDGIFVNAGLGYAPTHVITEDGNDAHFQVNYLAHFLLVLHLLDRTGRVVFNVTEYGAVRFDDLRLDEGWGYEEAIYQGMAAKRLFCEALHRRGIVSYGFRVHQTVWSNQLAIIPWWMRTMAYLAKLFGQFISLDECGEVMAPLFTDEAKAWSGRLLTWKDGAFVDFEGAPDEDAADVERLWAKSLELCGDDETRRIARELDGGGLAR